MPTSPPPARPLADLLEELEAAVRDGDSYRAERLRTTILQRLSEETEDLAAIERRVLELTADLDALGAGDPSRSPLGLDVPLERLPRTRGAETRSPSADADIEPDRIYPVWFGTNRKPAGSAGFSAERHDRITRGRVDVHVPEAHRFGETGTSLWRRLLRLDLRDDRLRVQRIETEERDRFFAEIREAMDAAARENRRPPHALFFLHGYNVSFEDAAIRAAQLACDLAVTGVTAFFSWPSRGSVVQYPADEASIEASERAITDFLIDFADHCGAEKLHVIAHSMGNRGLLRALQRIASNAEARGRVRFGQIFLAAPDVDRDLFLDLAELYPQHAEKTTLYASRRDLAVHLSSKVHDAPRAGYFTPYTVAPSIDTIAVPNFNVDLLGHSYFAQAEAMLHDMFDLLRHGEPPQMRQRLEPLRAEGQSLWRVKR
ncbi:MAG TPA: alpha/beta hydrolase [Thermoanaerobaculia bacterium]|jgi:esterase/lipase superfamily enzyme|nr:alpha/beta hydrolase [Thermoanaerobaculia bacterium]